MGFLLSFVLVGFALQLAAAKWPVRAVEHEPEVLLDAVALAVALVCQVSIAALAFPVIQGVQHVPAVAGSYHYLRTLSPLEAGLFYFLVVDFVAYWMHRLNHASWLWSTHAFHHSARNLYWASGMRGSPVHFVLLGAPSLLVQVVFDPEGIVLWLVLAYGVAHNSFIHSNLKVPRALSLVFVTGETHAVHHAQDPRLGGSNFGFLFTFWDRLFGTWIDPATVGPGFPLGLGYEVPPGRLLLGLPPPPVPSTPAAA